MEPPTWLRTAWMRRPFGAPTIPIGGMTVADAWLPGAGRLHTRNDGGSLRGGAPRAVWHTSETSPGRISARSVAYHLEQQGRCAHLVWNPLTGEVVQMVPATRAAHLLTGGLDQEGRTCLQVVVVGQARRPFTSEPMHGLAGIIDWMVTWQVARHWPAGSPLPVPDSYHAARHRRLWARGGHFGSSQVPTTAGPAPGAIDIFKITGSGDPIAGIPRQRGPSGTGLPLGTEAEGMLNAALGGPGADLPAPEVETSRRTSEHPVLT